MKVLPLNGNALIKIKEVKKIGSILLPDKVGADGARQAEVIAVSENSKLTVGQTVILPAFSVSTVISIENQDYLLCSEKDFLARIQ